MPNSVAFIENLSELKRGDILLFGIPDDPYASQMAIEQIQSMLGSGSSNLVHAGFCVGHNEAGVPIFAHLEHSFKHSMVENPNRFLAVYRHNNPKITDEIGRLAEQPKETQWWSIIEGAKSVLTTSYIGTEINDIPDAIDDAAICSKFVLQVTKLALNNCKTKGDITEKEFKESYPMIRSNSTPMTLEATLHSNPSYQQLSYAGTSKPFDVLKNTAKEILSSIEDFNEVNPSEKGDKLTQSLNGVMSASIAMLENDKSRNELDKAKIFVQQVDSVLKHMTNDRSHHDKLINKARSMGIYERDMGMQHSAGKTR
jgi:hypothetical protein